MYKLESKAILNENSLRVLRERGYLHIKEDGIQETPEEMFRRVARVVAEAEYQYGSGDTQVREQEEQFYQMMVNLDFLPNTPTLINAGKPGGQLAACFVLSIDDNMRSIFETLRDCSLIHQAGGGTGMDFSSLRPKGDLVKTSNGVASGVVSFMEVYNAATEAVKQGGARKGASMAVLRIDHPDILEFIEAKQTEDRLTNFNLSVAITDDFMRAVRAKETYPLINPRNNEVVRYLDANMVLDKIVEATHASGEPGVLFIDTINKANPTPRLGSIRATNPCQPSWAPVMTPYGPYGIGSIEVGDLIWSGSGKWTKVTNKTSGGIKDVMAYITPEGTFYGTSNHRVFSNGKKVEVGDALTIDVCVNPDGTYGINCRDGECISAEIIDVMFQTREEVFDITVDDPTHSYWTHGLIVSNCGEEPLLGGESCVLGSINLVNMLMPSNKEINWAKLAYTIALAVRFLDNVIDANCFPLPQIEEMTKANRKIGLGIMGFGDMLIRMGIRYDSYEGLDQATAIMGFINNGSQEVSYRLAEERGEFPNWGDSIFSEKRRNAALTCVAPTGSVSTIAGCSSGLEPIFSVAMKRNIIDSELTEVNSEFVRQLKSEGLYYDDEREALGKGVPTFKRMVKEIIDQGGIQNLSYIPDHIKSVFVTARDITPEWHIKMQAEFQKYVEGSLSKTVNLPNSATKEDVRNVYLMAYEMGCKSVTLYRDGSREKQVLVTGKKEAEVGVPVRSRPEIVNGMTRKIETGCGSLFVTINHDEEGKPFEIFARMSKSGGCASAQTESLGRLCALILRSNVEPSYIVKQLQGIGCHRPYGFGENNKILSCADAIAKVLADYIGMGQPSGNGHKEVEYPIREEMHVVLQGACPQCGSSNTDKSHCGGVLCRTCNYEECG